MPCDDIVGERTGLAVRRPAGIRRHAHRASAWRSSRWKAGTASATADPRRTPSGAGSRFGLSGAKLIWGGEACAVRFDGRANPKQLTMTEHSRAISRSLREILIKAPQGSDRRRSRTWSSACSSRIRAGFCKPNDNTKFESIIAYNHPAPRPEIRLSGRPTGDQRRRNQTADRRLSSLRPSARSNAASISSTSNIATAISATNFLSAVTGPDPMAAALKIARASCVRSLKAFAPKRRGLRIGVRLERDRFCAVQA